MNRISQEEAIEIIIRKLNDVNQKFTLYNSQHEGASVIREQFEEMWDEVKSNNPIKAKAEAVDLAVTAVRFIMSPAATWEK